MTKEKIEKLKEIVAEVLPDKESVIIDNERASMRKYAIIGLTHVECKFKTCQTAKILDINKYSVTYNYQKHMELYVTNKEYRENIQLIRKQWKSELK